MTQHNPQSTNHVLPLKVYFAVGAALFVLTAITVGVSFIQFGAFNMVIALLIAAVKATLVALFFMHLFYDNKFFGAILSISLLFVAVFIILTMYDTEKRAAIYQEKGGPIQKEAVIYQEKAP